MTSFVWMVRDGLKLQLPRDLTLYNYLNSTYAPLTYVDLRRAADFQNRVFRNCARLYHLLWFDVAAKSPLDPLLFGDAIHMTEQGLRLQAWIYLQMIAAWLEREVAAGRLPRPMQHPRAEHPDIHPETYRIISRASLLVPCRR